MSSPPSASPPAGLRAVIVDEWALFRQGVASVLANLGIEVVGEASGASDAHAVTAPSSRCFGAGGWRWAWL